MSLLLTLLAGLFIVIGIVLGKYLSKNKKFNDISIGLAFSVMILLIIVDIIPECFESLSFNNIFLTIVFIILLFIIGFIILKLLDKFVPHHEHEDCHHSHDTDECHIENLEHVGTMITIPLVIHNILEGMTIYLTSNNDVKLGLLLCIAIGLHNLPLGIMISTTLRSKKELIVNTIVLTLSTFLGGLIIFIFSGNIPDIVLGTLLGITVGMISYIIIDELLPNIIHNDTKKYNLIGIVIGVLFFIVSILLG